MVMPPSEPEEDQVQAQARPTTTEEHGMRDEAETSSSADEGTTLERGEPHRCLFITVEKELARRQAKAAAATVLAAESTMPAPEFFPNSPLLSLQYYYILLRPAPRPFSILCNEHGVLPKGCPRSDPARCVDRVRSAVRKQRGGATDDRRRLHVGCVYETTRSARTVHDELTTWFQNTSSM